MSCVQGFVREHFTEILLKGTLTGLLSFGAVLLLLCIFQRLDAEYCIKLPKKSCRGLAMLCILVSVCLLQRAPGKAAVCWVPMLVYFLFCSVTDYHTRQVYDVIQLAMGIFMAVRVLDCRISPAQGAELIAFTICQGVLFRRMYGEADVMCFLISALSMADRGMFFWVLHMGVAFLLLGVVQAGKHNIAKNGNLKSEVAFFPYIAAAYLLVFYAFW